MKRVVITGVGMITPVGHTVDTTWKALLDGVNGITRITRYDTTEHRAKLAAEVKNFNPDDYFDKMESRKLDLYAQYGIVSANEAVKDSGLVSHLNGNSSTSNINAERFGVYMGTGVGGFNTITGACDTLRERGCSRISAALVPMIISNIAGAHIAIKHGCRGPNHAIVTACATGAHCIGEAFLAIRHGYADAIIAGGAEASINPLAMAGFANMMALSTSDNPDEGSLPFDKRRAGFVMGEGAGAMVLEEYEHAKKRGAKIYAEITGYGNTCDAHHITAPDPNAEGLVRALTHALQGEFPFLGKGCTPTAGGVGLYPSIYYNAHGTGTELNDRAETLALKTLFGENAKKIAISSTKSMTGHLLGATGAVEAIVAVKSLETGFVPPTINLHAPDPELDLDYVPLVCRKVNPEIAISANLGFGGHNAVLVFKKHAPEKPNWKKNLFTRGRD